MALYGAIEAGGTKFICAYGPAPERLTLSEAIPTRGPKETLADVAAFFGKRKLKRVGIACFGPLDIAKGRIAKLTPKLEWRGYPIAADLEKRLGAKATIDTDVNAAALAEARWGAGKGKKNVVYVTVGTGIGAGLLIDGRLVHGLLHPELGHIRVRKFMGDFFGGACPVHGDCLEGLAAGPALAQRWGVTRAENLVPEHPAWGMEAHYLGQMAVNLACTVSPEVIVLGGGISLRKGMIGMVRVAAEQEMNGYVPLPKIVRAKLGAKAGVLGALSLVYK
jgi:fructokinase